MSDGRIPAFITGLMPSLSRGTPPRADIISLPPNFQGQAVNGEVTASQNGQVTIKTDQGNIVLQTDMALQVGQKVNLKLQVIAQNATNGMQAELMVIADPKTKPQTPVNQSNTVTTAPLLQTPNTISTDNIEMPDVFKMPVQNMNAKVIALPELLDEGDLGTLIKTALNLSPQKTLPPSLQEGLDKLKLLLPLLNTTLPPESAQAPRSSPVLSALITMLQSGTKPSPELQNFLSQVPTQTVFLLQQITPGQDLSPENIGVLKEQITILLQRLSQNVGQQAQIPAAATPTETNTSLLSNLVAKMKPLISQAASQQTEQIFQPLLGLTLGQSKVPTEVKTPVLLFMASPTGQQVISFAEIIEGMDAGKPLLPGTVLLTAVNQKSTITLMPTTLGAMPSIALETLPLNLMMGDTWPALEKLWQEVLGQQAQHPDVSSLLRQTIPTPTTQQMPAMVLFFLAMLKGGVPANWLDKSMLDKLPITNKEALIAQLGRDLQSLQSALNDPTPTDAWRPLPMPLMVNEQLVRLQWFIRHQYDTPQEGDSVDSRSSRKTRFLLDVPKTRLGDIQLDGLVQEKSLEVILRTESLLRADQQLAIRERYHRALETSGYAGGIIFQPGREHYVHA